MMFELALRVSLILAIAWLVAASLRRAAAATRHLVWHCAIVAVLLAPALASVAPAFSVPSLSGVLARSWQHMAIDGGPSLQAGSEQPNVGTLSTGVGSSRSGPSAGRLNGTVTIPTVPTLPILLTWAAGSLILVLWFALGWVLSAWTSRRAQLSPAQWQLEVNALRQKLRIRPEVHVRVSRTHASPLAVGLFRPTVLLPESALAWTGERRRAVLLHELAHIRRGDCRVQALAQTACAFYWWNPLIWMAVARLRSERERACDDEVLCGGTQPSAYAMHLLDIARDMRSTLSPSAALAMARRSDLEGRLLLILAAGRPRASARGTRWAVALTISLATAAALGATPAPARVPTSSAALESRSLPIYVVALPEPTEPGANVTVPALAEALDDGDQDIREKAALGLAFMSGDAVIPALLKALQDRDAQVREKAAIGLALRRDPRVVDALLSAIADPDPQVREKVAIALGTSGDPRAIPALERALKDPDAQVREKAATGFVLLGLTKP
jgi:bla regulator protein BlaR1